MSILGKEPQSVKPEETWEVIESNFHLSKAHKSDVIYLESHHKLVPALSLEQAPSH